MPYPAYAIPIAAYVAVCAALIHGQAAAPIA